MPSHIEKLTELACLKQGVTREELSDMCPKESYYDYMRWLCIVSECMAVWNESFIADKPVKAQVATMRKLKMSGVYKGALPTMGMSATGC